jgi:carbon storage regulator
MLVLTRKLGESICIGSDVQVVVLDAGRGRVKLGFTGPRQVSIRRGELAENAKSSEEILPAVMRQLPGAESLEPHSGPAYPPLREFRVVSGAS